MYTQFDVVIIGAGAVGCAIARELSRFRLRVAVVEKELDVAGGTSGRNSAVVHAGFNNRPGSLMAKLCVEGNQGFETICHTLNVPYKKTGKLLVAFHEEDMNTLQHLLVQGQKNGCRNLELVGPDFLKKMVPGVVGIGGMYSPETAIFDPFTYCVALAENAVENGVQFYLGYEVTQISRQDGKFSVHAGTEILESRYVVNSAGLHADRISSMAGVPGYQIYPCRGQYYILDKTEPAILDIPIYPAPQKKIGGLGVHLTPTIDGNVIIGPNAEYIGERDDYSCTRSTMEQLLSEAVQLLPQLSRKQVIGNYSGIRPKQAPPIEGGFRDFVIKEEPQCPGLINLIGIESPGLTASVPISYMIRDILSEHMDLREKEDFRAERVGILRFRDLSCEEQDELIRKDSDYGEIICRCQKITKKEIKQAIENPLGVRSISAIKYRAWATTGRCNGGYCLTKIVDILMNEYSVPLQEIRYRNPGSELFWKLKQD